MQDEFLNCRIVPPENRSGLLNFIRRRTEKSELLTYKCKVTPVVDSANQTDIQSFQALSQNCWSGVKFVTVISRFIQTDVMVESRSVQTEYKRSHRKLDNSNWVSSTLWSASKLGTFSLKIINKGVSLLNRFICVLAVWKIPHMCLPNVYICLWCIRMVKPKLL